MSFAEERTADTEVELEEDDAVIVVAAAIVS